MWECDGIDALVGKTSNASMTLFCFELLVDGDFVLIRTSQEIYKQNDTQY